MNRDKRGEELSILENRPTEMLQFAQGLWTIGLNMLATSNSDYYMNGPTPQNRIGLTQLVHKSP